jgi:hypothetical protein
LWSPRRNAVHAELHRVLASGEVRRASEKRALP